MAEVNETPLSEDQQRLRDMIMSGRLTVGQVMGELRRGIEHYCANRTALAVHAMWFELESDESYEIEQSGMMQASAEIAEQALSSFKELKVNDLDEEAKAIERHEYVIRALAEFDEDGTTPLYWSNHFGWVSQSEADVFTQEQKERFNLPFGGEWEQVEDD